MQVKLLFTLFVFTGLFACKNSNTANTVEAPHKDSTVVAVPKKPFEGVEFTSKMDMACGMLLSAGITDTVHYKDKIYGFCSAECKADFLKTPEAFFGVEVQALEMKNDNYCIIV